MDWATALTALAAALLGGGGIGSMFYVKETRRLKRAEADKTAAESWRQLAERKLGIIEKKDGLIERLYDERDELRKRIDELTSENARLRIYKCVKISCIDREPPFGSTDNQFDYGNIKGIAE